jgi:hypothetical protein
MKKQALKFSILALSLALTFAACQKEDTPPDETPEESTSSQDNSRFSAEIDAVSQDANLAIEGNIGFSGRGNGVQSLCDATVVVDTSLNPRTITITYNGLNCLGNRIRTGKIVISMPANIRWRDVGAAITVDFQNYKVTRVSDNKSITINGSKTITNQSGGLLINIATAGPITHIVSSNGLAVSFDNGTFRSWQVARKHVYSYSAATLAVLTVTGNHTEGTTTGIAEWGTNRFGNAFTTVISSALKIRQDCNFRLTEGAVVHSTANFSATTTFGLDASGNATGCPGAGLYYMKTVWTGPNNSSGTVIWPY